MSKWTLHESPCGKKPDELIHLTLTLWSHSYEWKCLRACWTQWNVGLLPFATFASLSLFPFLTVSRFPCYAISNGVICTIFWVNHMLTPKSANSLWGWHLSTTVPLRLWRGVLIEHCLHLATSYHHRLFRLKFLVLLCNLVETCWKTQLGNMVSVLFFEGRGRGNTWPLFSWKLCCTCFTFALLRPLSLSKVPVTLYRCAESGLRVAAAQARRTPDRLVERSRGTVPQVKSPTVHGYFTVHTDSWWSLWCASFLVPLKGRQSERLDCSGSLWWFWMSTHPGAFDFLGEWAIPFQRPTAVWCAAGEVVNFLKRFIHPEDVADIFSVETLKISQVFLSRCLGRLGKSMFGTGYECLDSNRCFDHMWVWLLMGLGTSIFILNNSTLVFSLTWEILLNLAQIRITPATLWTLPAQRASCGCCPCIWITCCFPLWRPSTALWHTLTWEVLGWRYLS